MNQIKFKAAFSFERSTRLKKLAYKLSLFSTCSRLARTKKLRKVSYPISLVNSHVTLMQYLFSFDQDMRVDKTLIQTITKFYKLLTNPSQSLTATLY